MTILPKKKVPKEKTEGDNSDHPPRSPTGDSLGHVSRRPASPPPRWNSPTPRDDRHDPGGRYDETSSGYKRRHRSSPHRTSRKHRHERTHERVGWEGASARPRVPPPHSQLLPIDIVPSTSNEEAIEEEHNSGDEYVAPVLPENIDELEKWFETNLKEKRGFIIKRMANDGACMFRSVADQVYGDQEMHHVVRKLCIDYMAKNQDFFSQYVTEDFNLYLARKQQANCHGNHIEMQVMCEIYNRPIEVYQYSIDPINTFISSYKTDNEPIRVSYHGNVHYNSVVHPYKATVGVGLGLPGFQPGLAEKNLMSDATKKSEDFHIEQTMLEDKLRETDWEMTQETMEEQVARESYLQWLREQEKRKANPAGTPPAATATATATATGRSSVSAACSSASSASPQHQQQQQQQQQSTWWQQGSTPPRSPVPSQSSSSSSSCPPAPSASASSSVAPSHPADLLTAVPGCSRQSASPTGYEATSGASAAGCSSGGAAANTAADFSPQLFGFGFGMAGGQGEWDEDDIMAQVMAASQQEYLDSLKHKMSSSHPDSDS